MNPLATTTNRYRAFYVSNSRFRLPEGHEVRFENMPSLVGPVTLELRSIYREEGFSSAVPRGLLLVVTGQAPSLNEAIDAFWHAAAVILPIIAIGANAAFADPRMLKIYDISPDEDEHEYRQDFLELPAGLPVTIREISPELITGLVSAWITGEMNSRMHRAVVNYAEALGHWRDGSEMRAVEALFMAAEAVTQPIVEREVSAKGCSRKKFAELWGLSGPKQLHKEARARLVFGGNHALSEQVEEISDGLEHSLTDLPSLQQQSKQIRDEVGYCVRRAILSFFQMEERLQEQLNSESFTKPIATDEVIKAIMGVLRAPAEKLLPPHAEPELAWKYTIEDVTIGHKEIDVKTTDNFTLHCEDGVLFQQTAVGAKGMVRKVVSGELNVKRSGA